MKRISRLVFISVFALGLGACATDDGSSTVSNMLFFNKPEAPDPSKGPTEALYCPKVDVFEGGAHATVGGGVATIGDLARECHVLHDGSVVIKVGVSGRVIPNGGGGGRYNVPVQFRIKVGDKVLVQRAQSVTATFVGDDVRGDFAAVQEGLVVPLANNQNFAIEVGLGGGGKRR